MKNDVSLHLHLNDRHVACDSNRTEFSDTSAADNYRTGGKVVDGLIIAYNLDSIQLNFKQADKVSCARSGM